MKGHTKIELTNVNTGEVETFEDDNMVTKALEYYLASYGFAPSVFNANIINQYQLWQSVLGGIMLFDTKLEESVENVFPPAGARMVANGAFGVSNNSNVTELGTYNTQESGVQADGSIKLVYDYLTSQGNGTIRSVALSSRAGGYIGAGNATSKTQLYARNDSAYWINGVIPFGTLGGFNESQWYITTPFTDTLKDMSYAAPGRCVCFVDLNKGIIRYGKPETMIYTTDSSTPQSSKNQHFSKTGKIVFLDYTIPTRTLSLKLHNQTVNRVERTVTLPDGFRPTSYSTIYSGTSVFILQSSSFANNATAKGVKIDKDLNVTEFTFTNTTGNAISYFYPCDEEHFIVVSAQKLYRTKYTGEEVQAIVTTDPSVGFYYEQGGKLIASRDMGSSDGTAVGTVIDLKNLEQYPLNGNFASNMTNRNNGRIVKVVGNPLLEAKVQTYNSTSVSIVRNCNYLATINNLDTPVVKTSAKTMKVTYTITF